MSFSGRASRRPESPRRPAVQVGQASRGVGKRGGEVGRFAGCNRVDAKKGNPSAWKDCPYTFHSGQGSQQVKRHSRALKHFSLRRREGGGSFPTDIPPPSPGVDDKRLLTRCQQNLAAFSGLARLFSRHWKDARVMPTRPDCEENNAHPHFLPTCRWRLYCQSHL